MTLVPESSSVTGRGDALAPVEAQRIRLQARRRGMVIGFIRRAPKETRVGVNRTAGTIPLVHGRLEEPVHSNPRLMPMMVGGVRFRTMVVGPDRRRCLEPAS